METPDLERLLREPGRQLADEPAMSREASEAIRAELRRSVRSDASRPAFRLLLGAVLAAAAAVLLTVLWPDSRDFGRVECQVALLDGLGRPFDTGVRGTGPARERPGSVVIEIVTESDAYASVVLFDPLGGRREVGAGDVLRVRPDDERLVEVLLDELPAHPSAASIVTILVATSVEPLTAGTVEAELPGSLERATGAAREDELASLAARLEERLGCAVTLSSFELEPAPTD